jgi:hypothetical protein
MADWLPDYPVEPWDYEGYEEEEPNPYAGTDLGDAYDNDEEDE